MRRSGSTSFVALGRFGILSALSATPLHTLHATSNDAGRRLDQFLATALPDVSRARVQQLIDQEKVRVDGAQAKASQRLRGNERVEILGEPALEPIKAVAEDIPLDIIYEDAALAIVNKPAGMTVHAGAGRDEARWRGTLVNALLHRFESSLSRGADELRPGIVHRLDKETSGLLVVAKNDSAHRKLSEQFAARTVNKAYIALVHGWPERDSGTIDLAISRDRVRRTRMTIRRTGGRHAVSHFIVKEKLDTAFGRFALLSVRIETGRTHQIRVHLASMKHPVVGDTTYGAPAELKPFSSKRKAGAGEKNLPTLQLGRNFLHAAAIELNHPETLERLAFEAPLPVELREFVARLRAATRT
jgi:23S rRNA pseudouridine1911/1915/1917 synthase